MDPHIIAFAVVAGVLTLTPGADTMLVIRNVLRGGRTDGVITTLGICSGLFVHATLSALGISILLTQSSAAFEIMKLVGACYLGWLGVQSLVRALRQRTTSSEGARPLARTPVRVRRSFLEGFLSNVLNPKVAVFYLALLPQFIAPTDAALNKSLILAGIHFVEGLLWLALLAVAIDRARRWFVESNIKRWLEGVCGVMLIGLGGRLALERQ